MGLDFTGLIERSAVDTNWEKLNKLVGNQRISEEQDTTAEKQQQLSDSGLPKKWGECRLSADDKKVTMFPLVDYVRGIF